MNNSISIYHINFFNSPILYNIMGELKKLMEYNSPALLHHVIRRPNDTLTFWK